MTRAACVYRADEDEERPHQITPFTIPMLRLQPILYSMTCEACFWERPHLSPREALMMMRSPLLKARLYVPVGGALY